MYPNLRFQLWSMGMRQNRLAQALGLDESLLSRILNGFRQPSPQLKRRIATLLGSDEEWLFKPVARPGMSSTPGPSNKSGPQAS